MATLSELRNLFRFGTDFTVVTPNATFQTAVGQNILEPIATTGWTDLWALPGGEARQHQDFNAVIEMNTANTAGQFIFEGSAEAAVSGAINLDFQIGAAPTSVNSGAINFASGTIVHYNVANPLKLRYVRCRISTAFTGATPGIRAKSVDYSPKSLLPQLFRNLIVNTVSANLTNIGGLAITTGAGPVSSGTQRIIVATGGTGATTSVTSAIIATPLLAAAGPRLGATIYNESTANLFVLLGAGTVSATNYTIRIAPNEYYEVPSAFTGLKVDGIWSAANGFARITTVA